VPGGFPQPYFDPIKMKNSLLKKTCGAALLSTAFVLAFAPAARATEPTFPNLTYSVTLNLGSVDLNPANGPLSLDLVLNTGSGNVTNTVTLSNFVFTGGTASGTPDYTNGLESGSLASSVVLTSNTPNTASDNEFEEAISSGVTKITFNVSQTPNSELVTSGTPIPDQFNVALQDGNFNSLATTDPTGNNNLLSSAISSSETASQVKLYTLSTAAVPEPSTYATLLAGLIALGAMTLRRRARHA
jgi:hypothetical protein